VIRRLHSSKAPELSCNSYVAITSASKNIARVTSVALMIPLKTFSMMMLGLAVLVVTGCAGGVGPATVAPTVDVTGTWAGTWVGTDPALGSGAIEMTLKQTESEYTGNLLMTFISIGHSTVGGTPRGPTQGVVSGNQVRVIGPSTGPSNLTGSLTVQGDSMTGTVQFRLFSSHEHGTYVANVTLTRQK